tara:strand:+ start:1423 stop:2004 length:582 start_codon:yes stop_codon:yes gene_type:complete
MIEYIYGSVVEKKTNYCIIDINGMGYNIIISLNTFNNLPDINEKVKILTYFSVSENNQSLFGFTDRGEKDLFLLLIGVSGIGPKTAINMLSAVPPKEFKNRLIAGEVKMLTSLPGIGPKTARRIIVELKDKFIDSGNEELPIEEDNTNTDAFYALRSLGFRSNDIRRVVNEVLKENKDLKTELVIKESLKLLR